MSLESATETIKNRVGDDCGLEATLKFDFGDAGSILIDATSVPNSVSNDDKDADCTVGLTIEDFEAMLAGDLAPTTAFMSGKLRVEGDMGVAMKLQNIM
jgi:putative sterol carrier protein